MADPPVFLESTHINTLELVSLNILQVCGKLKLNDEKTLGYSHNISF